MSISFSEFLENSGNQNLSNSIRTITQPQPAMQRKAPAQLPAPASVSQKLPFPLILENGDEDETEVEKIVQPSFTSKSFCVNIDSRDRDRDKFPNASKFQVFFNSSDSSNANISYSYKNIISIRLIECVVPSAVFDDSRYIVLKISELPDTMHGTNDDLNGALTLLLPDKVYGNFVYCKTKDMCNCIKKFDPPIHCGNKFTFSFLKPDGEVVDFGIDNAEEPTETSQVLMTYEIKTKIINRAELPTTIYT